MIRKLPSFSLSPLQSLLRALLLFFPVAMLCSGCTIAMLCSGCAMFGKDSAATGQEGNVASPARSGIAIPQGTSRSPGFAQNGGMPAGSARELLCLIDIVESSKRCLDLLGQRGSGSLSLAATGVEAARKRLNEIDTQAPADASRWTWTPVVRTPPGENAGTEAVCIADPPVRNASAVILRGKKKKGMLLAIDVFDANGASWEYPVNHTFTGRKNTTYTCYLHYPADVSRVVLRFAEQKDAKAQIDVSVGVTELPEYAKQAVFYYKWVEREIENGNPRQAEAYLKQAIAHVYHYRASRQLM